MIKTENFDQIPINSQEELRDWLLENHRSQDSVWLVTFKKSVPGKYVSREQVLDELLCFGWIDGIRRKLDDQRTMQLISPRKVQHWAKTYKDRAAKLIEEERMHPSGLQSIEDAKASGLWNFMDDVDQLIVPKDLAAALAKRPEAKLFFDAINDSSKRFVLRWLKLAKTEKTRTKRIQKLVELSAKGEKLPGS
ncbi:MAG: YdeI/OmpD-associated family protein [Bacteroidota bacterium]